MTGTRVKYAELVTEWLREAGYTHCFFVAGGNIMHLLDGARTRMTCIPVVHEVAAGIAVEYFNESGGPGRAFALVTAGPGITNIVTALGGAWLESRELLVLGGQVKSSDLATGGVRQRGIQEIDGVAVARPLCVLSERVEEPWSKRRFLSAIAKGRQGRPGPVFLEFCLDAQGAPVDVDVLEADRASFEVGPDASAIAAAREAAPFVAELTASAQRPIWLIGGGVSRATASRVREALRTRGIPTMTTWNGADRVGSDDPYYAGRPNTWGQRSANALVAQADVLVVLGSRLGLQQTGFNWREWARQATVVQVDIDRSELEKGHPRVDHSICADANELLIELCARDYPRFDPWVDHVRKVRSLLPLDEPWNETGDGFVDPYRFYLSLSELTRADDIVIPCSSGGANSVGMQAFNPTFGQVVITDKGLASMGYGLSGAIGAALAWPERRTIVVEGDGGFIQNLQELATVAVNDLNLKIFIFANDGYGSIRMTQKNYFDGAYLGCDTATGLGFPEWEPLFRSFGIPIMTLDASGLAGDRVREVLDRRGPHGFIVPVDPMQTYWPKITSWITATGSMESQPLHRMSPDLPEDLEHDVFRYVR